MLVKPVPCKVVMKPIRVLGPETWKYKTFYFIEHETKVHDMQV